MINSIKLNNENYSINKIAFLLILESYTELATDTQILIHIVYYLLLENQFYNWNQEIWWSSNNKWFQSVWNSFESIFHAIHSNDLYRMILTTKLYTYKQEEYSTIRFNETIQTKPTVNIETSLSLNGKQNTSYNT